LFRRITASLVLWIGVLAFAAPVLACGVSMMPTKDCCPEGEPSPCGEGGVPVANATCCVAAPLVSAAVAEAPRAQYEQPLEDGAPDPLILVAWFQSFTRHPAFEGIPEADWDPPLSRDATLTWLQTGRLRL
jgi:hypothetical protein